MAVTERPAIGTRVEGHWVHPEDPEQWERSIGTVIEFDAPLTAPQPEGAGLTPEDAEYLILAGVFDDRVAVKIESVEFGLVPDDLKGQLSNTYANFDLSEITVLDD